MDQATWVWLAGVVLRELTLFAAAGFLVGGLDELAVDLIWIGRTLWRRLALRHVRADADTLPPAARPGRIAVFVPAWDEAAVIGDMLGLAAARFGPGDWRIYVGCYPNDAATGAVVRAVAATEPRIRPVTCTRPGPTTKADCLNHLWRALLADEAAEGVRAKAVVLHDAEDVVHAAEMRVFDRLSETIDLVQLPVLPLIDRRSRYVAGHYADAFAEAHGKTLVVREAIGAAIPSAGVGCALARDMLGRVADARGGLPFDPASLTEDYELGLAVHALGGRGAFVRLPGADRGAVVAVREHFPDTMDAAVRQKARWMAGIALDGWDRTGWGGSLAENWMRLRDRRAVLAMLVLAAGYAALPLAAALWLSGIPPAPLSGGWRAVLGVDLALLAWRAAMRWGFVNQAYGRAEACRSLPRMVVGNIIDMAAAWRAVARYAAARGGPPRWDKTSHRFPRLAPAG